MQFLEKLWKMIENTEILNLSQQKEEETIQYNNQIIRLQIFLEKTYQQQKWKKKTEILMKKYVHLGISKLELSKILMFRFWYDYLKLKYGKKIKLCYIDTDSFVVHLKTDHIYKDIAEDVETRFDTSN